MAENRQYCTFTLNGLLFGVEVRLVQEVIRFQDMTAVPLAPHVIEGLINLRGQIVMAIDLRRRLGLPEREPGMRPMNVVVQQDDTVYSLLVDQVGDVITVDENSFEFPPDTMDNAMRELITGAHKLDQGLLLVLNTERATQFNEQALALKEA